MDVFLEAIDEGSTNIDDVQDTARIEESEQIDETESIATEEKVWTIMYRGIVETLSHFNIGRIVIRAIEQAKLKIHEKRIKLVINEMIDNGEITEVSISVLDELYEPIGTVNIECESIEESIYPGDVMEVSLEV